MRKCSDRVKDLKKARAYGLRLLAICPRTAKEMDARLKKFGCGEDLRGRLIESFKGEGLIDDLRFAEEWIEERVKSSPRSADFIKAELLRKGVIPEDAERIINDRREILNDRYVAREIIRRDKIAGARGKAGPKDKERLYRLLLSRGIGPEEAEETVNEYTGWEENES